MSSLEDKYKSVYFDGKEPHNKPLSLTGNEVVISGISGIFPSSENVDEFMKNLYNKVDMVIAVEPQLKLAEMPKHKGVIKGQDKFDAQFFKVTFNQSNSLDPMIRKLMELAYTAIYDAGFNPLEFNGNKMAVFIGSQYMDTCNLYLYENNNSNGFFVSGVSRTMLANRISYWMNAKAPSYSGDFSCSGALVTLQHAYHLLKTGQCDSAIVGCCNFCFLPGLFVNLNRAGALCLDGKTKCFDKHGDGFVRSEALSVIFLQRAKDARRIYTEVYHAKTKFNLSQGDKFSATRTVEQMMKFYKEFYSEVDVSPEDVEYVEANAVAVADADANEMESIGNFFGKRSPVQIGSVKSNMGNSESAAGACSLTKMCLAYHTGKIPGNLHYTEPQDISSIQENRLKVVVDNVPFKRGFVALNNFSYTGLDAHVLLKGHYKSKDKNLYASPIPYLITVSGRQEECVDQVLKKLEDQPVDAELIALLHKIYVKSTINHMGRGYAILDTNEKGETVSLARSVTYFSGEDKQICFVYSGMGSQWPGMGVELMKIPIFKSAIMKCHAVLQPKGIDVIKIISDTDKTLFDNILNSFIGITAIQIGLTDILKEMGIVPDILIGHSLGEMGCAYADGCFTAEETILTSYSRGLASIETDFIPGAMAAVGLGFNEVAILLPPEIDIACHNSSESTTISGPKEAIASFVEVLKGRGIFAKEVQSSGISYHSRYTAVAGPRLLEELQKIVLHPKERSKKWLCTSMPRSKWDEPLAKYSSAEYHVNNLLSPVYFEETCSLIPPNAVIIEIAPHGLLQAILKRSHSECANISLTKRGSPDPVKFMLQAIGKMYESGLNPNIAALYPQVEFPVSTETSLLSHFVRWDHSENWPVPYSGETQIITTGNRELVMSIHDDDFSFINNHIRNGLNVLPESFLLFIVWETKAMSLGMNYRRFPVKFNNVKFHSELIIDPETPANLSININKNENRFEVTCNETLLASGFVSFYKNDNSTLHDIVINENVGMNSRDVYKIFQQRGYSYKENFQVLHSVNVDCQHGAVKWTGEWAMLIDALIQCNILANNSKELVIPKLIQELIIDVFKHEKSKNQLFDNTACLGVEHDKILKVTRCGGVEMKNIVLENIDPKPSRESDILISKEFISHFPTSKYDFISAFNVLLQVTIENIAKENIKIIELITSVDISLLKNIKSVAEMIPRNINLNCQQIYKQEQSISEITEMFKAADVLLTNNLFQDKQIITEIPACLKSNALILSLEKTSNLKNIAQNKQFIIVSAIRITNENILVLLKTRYDAELKGEVSCIKIDDYDDFSWLNKLYSDLDSKKKVILLSRNQRFNGMTGIVTSLSKEYRNRLILLKINDINAPLFEEDNVFYEQQLQKQLMINILHEGQWGGFYNIPNKARVETENFALTISCPADFNSFRWSEIPLIETSPRTVTVNYAGLSLKDVSRAYGKEGINDIQFGMDFSGTDVNGNRVMGLIAGGAVAKTINVDSDLIWPVPDHWSLKEAATVPLAYVHAYYCLTMRALLYKGVSVIVTGGAGALGQAVISICLACGHDVCTMVSDNGKKKLLLRLFPQLKANQIFNSKDISSTEFIKCVLKNRRRNVVINCDSGRFREELMDCVGFMGHFLDISKEDAKKNEIFGMGSVDWDRNYAAVDLSNIFKPENLHQRKELQLIIAEGISKGVVKPLTSTEYSTQEITRAFKIISSRRNRGKVLLNLQAPEYNSIDCTPRIICPPDKSYMVFCDKEELGLIVIDLLVHRGAKKVILHLQKHKLSGNGEFKLKSWTERNVDIKLVYDDINSEEECCNIFNVTNKVGPVEGIFVVLDSIEDKNKNLSKDYDYSKGFNRLMSGIMNIEVISRESITDLRFFTIISQSSQNIFEEYVNSVCEEMCRARNKLGLPGLLLRVEGLNEVNDIATFCSSLEKSLNLNSLHTVTVNVKHKHDLDLIGLTDLPKSIGITDDVRHDNKKTSGDHEYSSRLDSKKQSALIQKENYNRGIGAFYNYIDSDLYTATEPFVPMMTRIINRFPKEDEVNPNETYLMLIPGFEGHNQIFKPLCERLKVKAFTIQLNHAANKESITEMALEIFQLIKKRLVLKEKFYLLGYSFGINVALELTNILEKEGLVGVVYCLDSSPDVLRNQLDSYLGHLSNQQLQKTIIEHMFSLVGQEEVLNEDLCIQDWDKKIDYFIQKVKTKVNYPHEYLKSLLNSLYKRIILAQNYKPTNTLNSQLILIKGLPHPDLSELPFDYNLSKYTKQEVKIFHIESDTVMAPYDNRIPNIVNRMLDPALIEEFNNLSSCEVYFVENTGFHS